ncbi:NAD-dependent epimerase/dehydratase family protein [Patulibacter sp. SYSU D01012]|uniref:NAD-dependent epimerase/dehydratase family protein n=1 Tax=Patulibacter sp. SYSU D01012 TaxID=2817381 RepID=UPI001B308A7B|nr:NAD-dependent epimerase/dehydratase family protein [Patulibacter sp. SYSU D01012]
MRVVVTGATGNTGSSLVRLLARDPEITEVVGFARRLPQLELPGVTWVAGDVREHDLTALFRGAAAVVHLVWRIQPSRDTSDTYATDVAGTQRVLDAVAAAGVRTFVHASSIAAYGPGPSGPDETRVDETWPITGVRSNFYSREKVAAEELVGRFEAEHPEVRVVRLRPALVFKRTAAQEVRRYFLGPLWPSALVRPGRLPLAPTPVGLRFQVVHTDDLAEAYRLAVVRPDMRGAYNVATEPVITPRRLRAVLGGLPLPVPRRALRALAAVTWRTRAQPTPPSWVDLAYESPLMDASRLRAAGWTPRHDGPATLRQLLEGLRDRAGDDAVPPLRTDAGGPLRADELRTGVGGRIDDRG